MNYWLASEEGNRLVQRDQLNYMDASVAPKDTEPQGQMDTVEKGQISITLY